MWNLVGFQTRLRIPEQQRVFRLIPGLADAEFLRFGSIHRNTYLNAPAALTPHLSLRDDAQLLFAGQLTGVEGYTESTATGLLAGINLSRMLHGQEPITPPPATMLGALYRYMREADPAHFQPMNANFGLLDDLEHPTRDKQLKRQRFAARSLARSTRGCRRTTSRRCGGMRVRARDGRRRAAPVAAARRVRGGGGGAGRVSPRAATPAACPCRPRSPSSWCISRRSATCRPTRSSRIVAISPASATGW
jgi:hypothetical protein